jgi:hypothetical protein
VRLLFFPHVSSVSKHTGARVHVPSEDVVPFKASQCNEKEQRFEECATISFQNLIHESQKGFLHSSTLS